MSIFVRKISPEAPASASKVFLLLHGFCEDHTIWNDVLPALKHHTVYLADLPGFGRSDMALPHPLTIDWVADTVYSQIVERENIKPIMVGHSLGGYVALAIAEKHAQGVAGLALFHSTTFADTNEKRATRNKVIDFVNANGVEAYTTQFVPGLFHSTFRRSQPDVVENVVRLASGTRQQTLVGYAAAMRDASLTTFSTTSG